MDYMTEKRATKEKKGRSHGTPGKYAEGCTCGPCTDRNTERNRIAREKRIATGAIPADVVHGASTFRNWNCHCPVCVQGNRDMLNDRNHAAGPGENRRKEWTSEELKIVSARKDDRRYAQTAYEVALQLGRSVSAVNKQRSVVKVNPEKINAAPGGN